MDPDDIDKAIALYGPGAVWEAPFRGQVYTDPVAIKASYLNIFRTVSCNRTTTLRRLATEWFVFDNQIADLSVIGDGMPNLGFQPGDRISMRLVHCFELENGKIIREIAYEMSRDYHGPRDHDFVPTTQWSSTSRTALRTARPLNLVGRELRAPFARGQSLVALDPVR